MKTRNKLILTILLVCIFSCLVSFLAVADCDDDVVVSLRLDDPMMEVNGIRTEIDAGRGTRPVAIEGRTLVPIRAIVEAFDGDVAWCADTQSVMLTMADDVITLVLNDKTAYLNGIAHTLDVAPTVINERTMLPVRFVAEGFNLGVAWDGATQTVSIIRNTFDDEEYSLLMSMVPDYPGLPYVEVNGGKPFFKEYEIIGGSFEYYSNLDELGRCDVTMASVSNDTMPDQERESIDKVTPTGWNNQKYDVVAGGYLYNRCHLIGYQLTGENANDRNLITGTRYLNIDGMLPFENMVDKYIQATGNHVIYRVTPVFAEDNLVADGVLMEAYSVEDGGAGVSFCVYCYNVQPNIDIDYKTGKSRITATEDASLANTPPQTDGDSAKRFYKTPTGKKYHQDYECGGKNSYEITFDQAKSLGLLPCSKCAD